MCVSVCMCRYVFMRPFCVSIFVTLCVSERVRGGGLPGGFLQPAYRDKWSLRLSPDQRTGLNPVSHRQSCLTPPASCLCFPRDYSCDHLFSVCYHPSAVVMLADRFLGHCAVIVTSDFKRNADVVINFHLDVFMRAVAFLILLEICFRICDK